MAGVIVSPGGVLLINVLDVPMCREMPPGPALPVGPEPIKLAAHLLRTITE